MKRQYEFFSFCLSYMVLICIISKLCVDKHYWFDTFTDLKADSVFIGQPSPFLISLWIFAISNKKNDKGFNNRVYALFFLMDIFLKHLWFIPDILKWQNCKIFTNLVPSQNPSRRSHRKCSVKKDILKNLQNLLGKHLCWSLF